jgi:predicted P-loop ATPase
MSTQIKKFDIRDYRDSLTPAKKKGKFHCPVCDDPNLSIDNKTGGYTCYKGGCSASEIQEAIRPWSEVQAQLDAEREEARKRPVAQYLNPKQLKEFESSAIPEDLARMNLYGVECSHQIAEFLGWKGYQGPPGWLYTGVDPETGKDTGIGQFKPEEELIFPDGKIAKYLTQKRGYDASCSRVLMWVWRKASERYSVPLPDGTAIYEDSREVTAEFWQWVIDNPQIPLDPAEGKKKALALLAQGLIGVAISGVDLATLKGRGSALVPSLQKLAVKGRPVVINYDADIITKPDVRDALIGFNAALTQRGCTTAVRTWDLELGKGIDDLIFTLGENWENSTQRLSYKQWLKELENGKTVDLLQRSFEQESDGNNSPAKSKNKRLLNLIGARWGERLRLNEMTQQVEMDGEEINIEQVYFRMAEELDIDVPKQKASDLVVILAKKNTYSPVRDYLNSLADVPPISLENLAERYLGTSDPLHQILLKRTLIAAVARVFKPGCKVDTLCIFQGDQGFLKSTFWQTLIGECWFTDNLNDANEKDEKLKLRRYWGLEFSEFETAYKRKKVEQLKAFLSSRIDSLRVPYGKTIEDFARTSIFVGSTNGQEFLHDPTGERRYWVIPAKQKIPIQILKEERDQIWAAAVELYRAGEQWWLTPEEDALLTQANQAWQSSDAWEADILSYLETKSICTISELLNKPLAIDLQHQGKAEQMRVGNILRRNGWKRAPSQKRIDGKPQWYWEKVVTGGDGVVTEVVTPLKPLSARISKEVSPPVTTFSSNFSQNSVAATETDETKKNKSFENGGGDTPAETLETLTAQGLEGVTTSPSPPQITHNSIAPPKLPAPIALPEPETLPTAPTTPPIAPSLETAPKSKKPAEEFKPGDRVRIRSDYPASKKLIGKLATVKKDWRDGSHQIQIEFDEEIEVEGAKPRKIFSLNQAYLNFEESPPKAKKAPKEFKIGDRVVVAGPGTYQRACGVVKAIGSGQKYRIEFDKAVRGSLSAEILAADLMPAEGGSPR